MGVQEGPPMIDFLNVFFTSKAAMEMRSFSLRITEPLTLFSGYSAQSQSLWHYGSSKL